jgi:hypothetical protein
LVVGSAGASGSVRSGPGVLLTGCVGCSRRSLRAGGLFCVQELGDRVVALEPFSRPGVGPWRSLSLVVRSCMRLLRGLSRTGLPRSRIGGVSVFAGLRRARYRGQWELANRNRLLSERRLLSPRVKGRERIVKPVAARISVAAPPWVGTTPGIAPLQLRTGRLESSARRCSPPRKCL